MMSSDILLLFFFLGETWTLLLPTAPWELSGESNVLLLMLRGHVTASSMFARLCAFVWCVCVVMLASGARVRASGDLNSASSTAPIHCARKPFIKCRCLSHPQDHSLLQQLRGSGGLKIPQQMVHVIFLECQSCATTLSHCYAHPAHPFIAGTSEYEPVQVCLSKASCSVHAECTQNTQVRPDAGGCLLITGAQLATLQDTTSSNAGTDTVSSSSSSSTRGTSTSSMDMPQLAVPRAPSDSDALGQQQRQQQQQEQQLPPHRPERLPRCSTVSLQTELATPALVVFSGGTAFNSVAGEGGGQ
jgi:hypothetical protein